MRKLLMKAGVPIVAGGLVLSGIGGAAIAGASVHQNAVHTYKIAYEGPLSGGNAQLGLNMVYSVELAIAQWNAKKGDPFKLAIQKLDDQGDPTLAPTEAHLGVSSATTLGVVGPAFSGATLAAQAVYGPAHMPLVSPSATNALLVNPVENPDHNFFRVVADDSVQGPADANYVVKTLKYKNVYVVNDGSTYGSGLAAQFAATAHTDGADGRDEHGRRHDRVQRRDGLLQPSTRRSPPPSRPAQPSSSSTVATTATSPCSPLRSARRATRASS